MRPFHTATPLPTHFKKSMSGKKKTKSSQPSRASTAPPTSERAGLETDSSPSCLLLKVLYSGRKGDLSNRRKGFVSSADLKRLGLRQGSSVVLHIEENGVNIMCDLWISNQALPGNITLSRFWTPVLSSKQVIVRRELRSISCQFATSLFSSRSFSPLLEFVSRPVRN
jgi:hypothetical protein